VRVAILRAGGLQKQVIAAGVSGWQVKTFLSSTSKTQCSSSRAFNFFPGPMEPDLDVFHGDPQDLGDFPLAELADIRKNDDTAERFGRWLTRPKTHLGHLALFCSF